MKVKGIEGMDGEQLQHEVGRGGRFVIYQFVISALVLTFRRSTSIYFVRGGESAVVKGLPWTALSLLAGWWGFPWGFIYTPVALYKNLAGGTDVTAEVLASLGLPPTPSPAPGR